MGVVCASLIFVLFVMVRVMEVLTGLGNGTEEIDMTRIKTILSQRIIKILNVVRLRLIFFLSSFCLSYSLLPLSSLILLSLS